MHNYRVRVVRTVIEEGFIEVSGPSLREVLQYVEYNTDGIKTSSWRQIEVRYEVDSATAIDRIEE